MEAAQEAVKVCNACKAYGSGKRRNVVLDGFNMTVPTGAIYGLLGASGSGKTTLLSTVAGLQSLDSGEIRVLGSPPFTGPTIGYMPQEVSLMGDFSISDTMFLFGRIMGMPSEQILSRLDVLSKLLELPSKDKFVGKLSGGQMRRVSLAVTMLHDPELLILDEPTVGLDPLLRNRIWDHMLELTRTNRKTIIITTHYIEEARQSDVVGLMRGGKLLAESPPENLLSKYECSTLEETFLLLSERQQNVLNGNQQQLYNSAAVSVVENMEHLPVSPQDQVTTTTQITNQKFKKRKATHLNVMQALMIRNFLLFIRNPGSVAFGFGFALVQMVLFFIAIGNSPQYVPLAVVNEETFENQCNYAIDIPSCNSTRLSCRFLDSIDKKLFNQIPFNSLSIAENFVRKGDAWGVIHFGSNFTEALRERERLGKDATDDILYQSEITIKLDMSDGQMAAILSTALNKGFQQFLEEHLVSCNVNVKHGKLPLRINEPIYGDKEYSFLDAIIPGTLVTIVYFLGIALTSFSVLADRLEGISDRIIVSGATETELLVSHALLQTGVVAVQCFETLFVAFVVYNVTNYGSIWLVSFIVFLEGVCGMTYGLLISVVCKDIRTADILSMGSVVPVYMICGVLWPTEGIPFLLREFSKLLPVTSGTNAVRSILGRGAGFANGDVQRGIITLVLWTIATMAFCVLFVMKNKR